MSRWTGVRTLGPASASLRIHTGKEGKAALAGHDLEIEVRDWSATLEPRSASEDLKLSLTANSRSLRVIGGTGGMQGLDDAAKADIAATIDSQVLRGGEISFRSTRVRSVVGSDAFHVDGDLNLLGTVRSVAFTLAFGADGSLEGEALVRQTDFGMKPYSALFGALKVKDEVRVTVDGRLNGGVPA